MVIPLSSAWYSKGIWGSATVNDGVPVFPVDWSTIHAGAAALPSIAIGRKRSRLLSPLKSIVAASRR
jgi:hypothetical protein